jgi:hypothetical protein
MRIRPIGTAVMLLATGFVPAGEAFAADPDLHEAACGYQVRQLPGLPGGVPDGQVLETDGDRRLIGWGFLGTGTDPYPHGTIWRDGVVTADWGPLNGVSSVNRSGDAVGAGFGSSATVVVPNGGTATRLARPAGMTRALPSATSIGDDGLIVGHGLFDDGSVHALTWSPATAGTTARDHGVLGIVGFPPPPATQWPGQREVSDTGGRIVGSTKSGSRLRAVAGTAGNLVPLSGVDPNLDSEATDIAGRFVLGTGTVPGQGTGSVLWEDGAARLVSGTATDVNSSGTVVGYDATQAFVLADGVRTALPSLPGHTQARALTVTEDGRAAGWSRAGTAAPVPVVWTCG